MSTSTATTTVDASESVTGQALKFRHRPLTIGKVIILIIGALGAIGMILPFLWMVLGSFKPLQELFIQPPTFFPKVWTMFNYKDAWAGANPSFLRAGWNSLYIAVLVTVGTTITSAFAAYAFARIPFFGRGAWFSVFLATMMVPGQLTIIPLYVIMSKIGWNDTHLPLIIPPILFNAFGVFLLRQYVRGIPLELEEAAAIDGASRLGTFFRIILPLLRSPMTALGIFTFLAQWNNFFYPLIFLSSGDKFTLPLLIASFKGQYSTNQGAVLAASTISALPLLIMFIIMQRQIVEGIALSGSKT